MFYVISCNTFDSVEHRLLMWKAIPINLAGIPTESLEQQPLYRNRCVFDRMVDVVAFTLSWFVVIRKSIRIVNENYYTT